MNKIKAYLKELTIVTIGVLIALIIGNFKENSQARKYHIASIKTIKNEVAANNTNLANVLEKQTRLQDTIEKYITEHISLEELILKANGLQGATLSNTGLEFYSRNEMNSIDFEMMSILIRMNTLSELIGMKMEKLLDFVYPNIMADTEESKRLLYIHLDNVIESETQLRQLFEDFINEYVKNKPNSK
jgi:uncharacterized protein YoxC